MPMARPSPPVPPGSTGWSPQPPHRSAGISASRPWPTSESPRCSSSHPAAPSPVSPAFPARRRDLRDEIPRRPAGAPAACSPPAAGHAGASPSFRLVVAPSAELSTPLISPKVRFIPAGAMLAPRGPLAPKSGDLSAGGVLVERLASDGNPVSPGLPRDRLSSAGAQRTSRSPPGAWQSARPQGRHPGRGAYRPTQQADERRSRSPLGHQRRVDRQAHRDQGAPDRGPR